MTTSKAKYTQSEYDWLWDEYCQKIGRGLNDRRAAEEILPEWRVLTGRDILLRSLSSMISRLKVKHREKQKSVAPEQVACASYAVFVPAHEQRLASWSFFESPGEAQQFINKLVEGNHGYFPQGVKLFGEIVVETSTQVSFKTRSLSTYSTQSTNVPEKVNGREGE